MSISELDALIAETHALMRGVLSAMSGLDHDILLQYRLARDRRAHAAPRMYAYVQFVFAQMILAALPRSRYRIWLTRFPARRTPTQVFRVKSVLTAMKTRFAWRAQFSRMPPATGASPR